MTPTVHPHPATAHGPADTGLALAVAALLRPAAGRAPELVPPVAARRAARGRRAAVRG
ncbi:hypothetical protein GTW43_21120 [Streptomyces sp. SID5785]|uniref:hypothetical protein n=1 Tax=Streptomyces sp. SID5785 TaxID=2690309 RepID=UPI001361C3E8|nr:hypothetical protein [Streptomyces sp. SID5785]MZD07564.1 hypothetical protein [Streptomyces sp. SID5785]